ncbi:hypothetical protein Tco_1102640 [Tanacetum coccineum]
MKATFTALTGTFAYRLHAFWVMAYDWARSKGVWLQSFTNEIEKTMEVFMDDSQFSVILSSCLSPFRQMLQRCERPICAQIGKKMPLYGQDRHRLKLTKAPILVAPDWDLPFLKSCVMQVDFAVGAVSRATSEKKGKLQKTFTSRDTLGWLPLLVMINAPWFAFCKYQAGNFGDQRNGRVVVSGQEAFGAFLSLPQWIPTVGTLRCQFTAKKIFDSGCLAHDLQGCPMDFVSRCDHMSNGQGKMSLRDEMPQTLSTFTKSLTCGH